MRTIKFRAWNDALKKMEIAPEVQIYDFSRQAISLNEGCAVWGEKLMQFTGLLDKNGKEIYEGDIIRGKWKEAKINPVSISVCPPILEGFHFYSEMDDRDDEVIGNIYENPELLK